MKKLVIALLLIVALVLGVGMLLPSEYTVVRTIVINSDEAAIYPMIANLEKWQEWCPWNKETYPDMDSKYTGPPMGKDAVWTWSGTKSGNGKLKITGADPKTGIVYDLHFDEYPVSKCELSLKPVEGGIEVSMKNVGNVGNSPISRYFGLMMDGMMGKEFEKGLEKLKATAEKS